MKSKKGFTLIELMVVILIVAILAAVAIPIMRGRIDAAKWSEGRAIMGSIATAIRAYAASEDGVPGISMDLSDPDDAEALGFAPADLDGTYFTASMFTVADCTYDPNDAVPLLFDITATNPALNPETRTLDESGQWGL